MGTKPFIVIVIDNGELGRMWSYNNFEEAVDHATRIAMQNYSSQTLTEDKTRQEIGDNALFYKDGFSIHIGQCEN